MAGYAIGTNTLFVTTKPLKRKKPTKEYIDRVKFIKTHNISVNIVNGEAVVTVTDK